MDVCGFGCREKEVPDCTLLEKRSQTVLDSLVRTILSQNTTDTLSKRAFDSLKVIQIDPLIYVYHWSYTHLGTHA